MKKGNTEFDDNSKMTLHIMKRALAGPSDRCVIMRRKLYQQSYMCFILVHQRGQRAFCHALISAPSRESKKVNATFRDQ